MSGEIQHSQLATGFGYGVDAPELGAVLFCEVGQAAQFGQGVGEALAVGGVPMVVVKLLLGFLVGSGFCCGAWRGGR